MGQSRHGGWAVSYAGRPLPRSVQRYPRTLHKVRAQPESSRTGGKSFRCSFVHFWLLYMPVLLPQTSRQTPPPIPRPASLHIQRPSGYTRPATYIRPSGRAGPSVCTKICIPRPCTNPPVYTKPCACTIHPVYTKTFLLFTSRGQCSHVGLYCRRIVRVGRRQQAIVVE